MKEIVKSILKQANFIKNLERFLKLDFDDQFVSKGMKIANFLDKLESQAPSLLEKNQISDIRHKIRSAMQTIQESQEELFYIQQQLINEENQK